MLDTLIRTDYIVRYALGAVAIAILVGWGCWRGGRRIVCWWSGHLPNHAKSFPDERFHGCRHYAAPGCKCIRCGKPWEVGDRCRMPKPRQ